MPPLRKFVPTIPASVVITYREAPETLELTLAALERQTYPRGLFEVVIVGDAEVHLAVRGSPLQVRVVHQGRGFRFARARNTGARAASHPILVFLDHGMLPEADWLSAHARWHHEASDVLTIGFEAQVDIEGIGAAAVRNRPRRLRALFRNRPHIQPDQIEFHMIRTNQLTSVTDDLFLVTSSDNLGISRDFFELVGGFDDSFTYAGVADIQFGFRAYTLGGLFVPVRQAFCWRHDRRSVTSESDHLRSEVERAKASHLIAHTGFRDAPPGRSFTIPRFVVTVDPCTHEPDVVLRTVEKLLDNSVHDIVVWVGDRPHEPGYEWLRRLLESDPRVYFGPLDGAADGFPGASFHINIPAGVTCSPDMIDQLRRQLGVAAAGVGWLNDESPVWIARAWAVHRARRLNCEIGRVGLVVTLDTAAVDPATGGRSVDGSLPLEAPSNAAKALRKARAVRTPGQAWRFGRWTLRAIWARMIVKTRYRLIKARHGDRWLRNVPDLERLTGYQDAAEIADDRQRGPGDLAGYALGGEILVAGKRASQVLAASGRIHRTQGAGDFEVTRAGSVLLHRRRAPRHIDVVLADSPSEALDVGARVVVLSDSPPLLSTPAFDPERVNPRGWVREVDATVGALGPVNLLSEGVPANTVVAAGDRSKLLNIHHVEDSAAFHTDPARRAGTLVALAAAGVPVHLNDPERELRAFLGDELFDAMSDERIRGADAHLREAISVRMRRAALRDHSLRRRARQVLGAAAVSQDPLPEVSILLATKRPKYLANALEMVARQTYPRLQLVLALHGGGFPTRVDVAGVGHGVEVVRVPAETLFGSVLNAAVAASGGLLLTKFDDDDIYGPEHVWDLVLAREYSRGEVVAKGAEFVYLSGPDRTLHRFAGEGEAFSKGHTVAGGTLLISRHDLYAAGGWRRIPRSVDLALIEDVRRDEGSIYRTHGFGYMMVRHGGDHVTESPDKYFLRQAEEIRYGLDPDFAGVGEVLT